MVQRIKVFRQVEYDCPRVSLFDVLFYPSYGIFGPSSRSIAKTVLREQRFIDWYELLCYCLLDDAVYDGRIPSFRIPLSGFGISTLLTGEGVYFPFLILFTSSWLFSLSHGNAASIVIPSTPGARTR